MLSALQAIHARGIVHRHLEPSNTFLTAHGIKLLDFGLAVQEVSEQTQAGITMPGIVMGTPTRCRQSSSAAAHRMGAPICSPSAPYSSNCSWEKPRFPAAWYSAAHSSCCW